MNQENTSSELRSKAAVILRPEAELHFLQPYIEAAFGPDFDVTFVQELSDATARDVAVAIVAETEKLPESSVIPVIMVPEIVGTCMCGLPRRLVEDVASGHFFSIRDTDYPRVRVVHATDVASAARLAALRGEPGAWRLDDGHEPTLNALADALAYRMNGKRLFALPRKWARLFGVGRKWLSYRSPEPPAVPSFVEDFGYTPAEVCTYLRTHIYDESSL